MHLACACITYSHGGSSGSPYDLACMLADIHNYSVDQDAGNGHPFHKMQALVRANLSFPPQWSTAGRGQTKQLQRFQHTTCTLQGSMKNVPTSLLRWLSCKTRSTRELHHSLRAPSHHTLGLKRERSPSSDKTLPSRYCTSKLGMDLPIESVPSWPTQDMYSSNLLLAV